MKPNVETGQLEGIAIIGMAGRFPGAGNVAQLWQNLCGGVEAVNMFTDEQLLSAGVDPEVLHSQGYVKAGLVLEGIESFDAAFFGLSPREAEITDPQHRIFLECAWEALENAGYDSEQYPGRIGVFAGSGPNNYLEYNRAANARLTSSLALLQKLVASQKDHLATRVSYKLNLRGPSLTVQTACSTSLVAVHLACQSLLSGESDMALAGGVSARIPQPAGYLYQEGGILSPDCHCRAFDALAKGTAPGSGVGIVVLKRMADAVVDGDCIHAVIKGSAINNDGAEKVGYTAPSVDGQAAVIAEAQALAGVTADAISYVEAHGTGTPLGDSIEVAALTKAFRATTERNGFCALGSIKTNIGHLDAAAGVAGLIKTGLALRNRMLPPSLNFENPNPSIDFANSPFYVQRTLSEWKPRNGVRVAGVSSFGIGGTNAHVVVEEASSVEPSGQPQPYHLLSLSARTPTALEQATVNLTAWIRANPQINPADVAYTLQVGRKVFAHRRCLVARDGEDALGVLTSRDPGRLHTGFHERADSPVAFMFPGQAAQYVNMGWDVYHSQESFRTTLDYCCDYLKPHLGLDLRQVLYPPEDQHEEAGKQLGQTAIAQPALFILEYALARLWMKWSIRPDAMIGHSIGEYVAACLAGVFSLEDALTLVAARGRLMQSLPAGSMLSVRTSEHALREFLGEELALAVVNGPSLCVASGPTTAIEGLERRLAEKNVACRLLHTSHAFHSQMMDPIMGHFRDLFKGIKLSPPKVPYLSNLTGTWITPAEAADPDCWASHLRRTVRFSDGVAELLKTPHRILLEVGPGQMLATMARQQISKGGTQVVLSTFGSAKDRNPDPASMLGALGQLWIAGASVRWPDFYEGQGRRRVPLPTYPFERQRYWIEASGPAAKAVPGMDSSAAVPNGGPDLCQGSADTGDERGAGALDPGPMAPAGFVPPRNEIEERVAEIWSEILGVKSVGVNEDFSGLGGDSLLATQVLSRMRSAFKVELPMDAFFGSPTVAGQAELVQKAGEAVAKETEKISRLVEQVEHLSEEELRRLNMQI